MGIEIEAPKDFAKKNLKAIRERNTKALEVLMIEAQAAVKTNPPKSKDFDGKGLKPSTYSREYRRYREKLGRPGGGVDLTITGAMLKAVTFTIKQTPKGLIGELFFKNTFAFNRVPRGSRAKRRRVSTLTKARAHQERYNFFGLNRKAFNRFIKKIK